ncbi:hypothetical protein [Tepidibacter hydrothermalis]|uniref:Uncharacterized protein n=1 Tax=Tepidibacter hydrothermalis TaxID=3036126 RepID=A0ABY8EGB9_9FIRM|nr:hypothetical protein [Tepidibacter hydrothermalis]WFD11981.1 hypothetical protein P4S50_07860 [Tepidibacter hydrothermalis]
MNKQEKQLFLKFKESLIQEINHSEKCINQSKEDIEDTLFWTGAKMQAKEILNNFSEIFNLEEVN